MDGEICVLATREGHLPEVGPVLDRIQQAGLHSSSPDALAAVRRLVSESR